MWWEFCFLLLGNFFVPSITLRVIITPRLKNETGKTKSFTRIVNITSPVLDKLTACSWFSMDYEDLGSVWASRNEYFGMRIKTDTKSLYIGRLSHKFKYPENFSFVPEQWIFFCFSYDNIKKSLRVFVNAKVVLNQKINQHLDSFIIKENFLELEKFGKANQFSGKFTDINIWSSILKDDDIEDMSTCRIIKKSPDILLWKEANFNLGPMIYSEDVDLHPCHELHSRQEVMHAYKVDTAMEPKMKAIRLCHALGGSMRLPSNEIELQQLSHQLSNFSNFWFWTPMFKGPNVRVWKNASNKRVTFLKWRKNQPNGGDDAEKCAAIAGIGSQGVGYFDTHCSKEWFFYCSVVKHTVFKLHGLCDSLNNALVDTNYVLQSSTGREGRPYWKGFKSSEIGWNATSNRWEISNGDTGDVIAISKHAIEFPVSEHFLAH